MGKETMDLIRLRVRPQTPVPPWPPASPAPEPEGTGKLRLSGELGENAAAFLFGIGGAGGTPPATQDLPWHQPCSPWREWRQGGGHELALSGAGG